MFYAETYLQPSWTSAMELFAKIVTKSHALFSQKKSIVDVPLDYKYASLLYSIADKNFSYWCCRKWRKKLE